MRNYIILNNKKSDTISGLIIQELPAISKPAQRTQIETIDGRDGDIVTPLGYAAYDKTFTIGLYGTFDINEIIAYFATQGQVIFSNEPNKYYNYQIVDQIDYERLVRYRVATVTMHVQPFKYSATEGTITVDASDTISGEGSNIALDGTAEAPFNILRHKGNATQKTYSGKNLQPIFADGTISSAQTMTAGFLSLQQFYTGYSESLTASNGALVIEPSGTSIWKIIATGLTANTTYTLSADYSITLSQNGNVFILGHFISNLSGGTAHIGRQSLTFTTDADGNWRSTSGTAETLVYAYGYTTIATFTNIQLEKSASASSYEPYVGGTASPNPDYPQDIKLLTGDSTIAIDDGGDNSQEYVIPFGDTYLAAIGDYADEPVKVDGTWYIRRAIGKKTFVGEASEGWDRSGNTYYTAVITDYATANNIPFSNQFIGVTNVLGAGDVPDKSIAFNDSHQYFNRFYVRYESKFPDTPLTTWLQSHPMDVYYALATPTDEAITDQDLIDALDDFINQAHAYKGHTHITATAADGNAPAVLAVDVNEDNESTVTNAGNTTSRPILTIYGQGDIGVYINDVEVLDIALGDEGYITLDSVEMEAYKDTTANLKNRLVTGDYSKLALNAGANKIRFTGKVTKYEISKYSRWL